jgi:hypothetical protein
MRKRLQATVLALMALAVAAPAAQASVESRAYSEIDLARAFWAERGVTGCDAGITVEVFNEQQAAAMQGGFCRVRVNLYWQRPNPWGLGREIECALVVHEVKHALPGGETGGIDGQGHTEDGIMATAPSVVPYECVRWARSSRRARVARWRVTPHPMKGVVRG